MKNFLGESLNIYVVFRFTTIAALVTLVLSSSPAHAYKIYGATWSNPGSSRTLYFMDSSFSANEEALIASLNMAYDAANTNLVDPLDPGSSTLNISGTLPAATATIYNSGTFKLFRNTVNWPFAVTAPGITCRNSCLAVNEAGANKATVYLNDFNYNFGTLFTTTNVDFATVLLHELGHAHGLGHPTSPLTAAEIASVMYPNNKIKRTLTNEDILGLEVLY